MDDVRPVTWAGRLSRLVRGISFQLVILLSLAVLPIGVVSVVQSLSFASETRHSAETLLLGLTQESAALEHRLIETGLRMNADLVAEVISSRLAPVECSRILADFIRRQSIFWSVRFVGVDGMSSCTSQGPALDLSAEAPHLRILGQTLAAVERFDADGGGAVPVWLLTQPIRENGQLIGYLSLVMPSLRLSQVPKGNVVPVPEEVALFNARGAILTSTLDLTDVRMRLPPPAGLAALLRGADTVTNETDLMGRSWTYVKVTLIRDVVFAIGIWPKDNPVSRVDGAWANAVGFPLLLWAVSLTTALLAARRLVIRPVKMLRDEMRRFARGHRGAAMVLPAGAALEIQEAIGTFSHLERIVTSNEAALALTAEGKILMLREVHHRIKNNMQMISSIISIQWRKTRDADARQLLRGLQDRVLSIAAVDQSLYLDGEAWDVRADLLIASITDRLIGANLEAGHAVRISARYEPLLLHADQIGPLSLLANEAVTNALKYVGTPRGEAAFVDIHLKWDGDVVVFSVKNSVGVTMLTAETALKGANLGKVLIQAFSDQLAAECKSGLDDGARSFSLTVRFRPSDPGTLQTGRADLPVPVQAAILDGTPL